MAENSLEIIKVNYFIRRYHVYMTRWEPTTGDVYKFMREPSNIKDSKAVAIVRGKSGEKETQQADDVHPNNMTNRFEVIGQVPALMATWLSNFLKRPTNCAKVIIKGKRVNGGRWLRSRGSLRIYL